VILSFFDVVQFGMPLNFFIVMLLGSNAPSEAFQISANHSKKAAETVLAYDP
jgi:hypothetical protein